MTKDLVGPHVYLITNQLDGMKYVGQSAGGKRNARINAHHSNARNRPQCTMPLVEAIRKDGFENFKVEILEVTDEVGLYMAERFWIRCFNTLSPGGYNLSSGGRKGSVLLDEARQKMRKPKSEECKRRMRKPKSAEHSKKLGDSIRSRSALTWETVRAMRSDRLTGMTYRELAAKYGVAIGTISHIVNGQSWKDNHSA